MSSKILSPGTTPPAFIGHSPTTCWVAIDVSNFPRVQISNTLLLAPECRNKEELDAVIAQMKHELDDIAAQASF